MTLCDSIFLLCFFCHFLTRTLLNVPFRFGSIELVWSLFVSPEFDNLRRCVCGDEAEFLRFRQLLVNIVMATDVHDKDLNVARRQRWDKAFAEDVVVSEGDKVNRKATIVLEHLIQASDVAHTMQHWQ